MATHDRHALARHLLARLGILAAASLGATHAHAQDLATRPWLLGDWGGERTRLAERGIDFNFGYGTELAHNASGGTRHLTRYTTNGPSAPRWISTRAGAGMAAPSSSP